MSGDNRPLLDAVQQRMHRWWRRVLPWWVGALLLSLAYTVFEWTWLEPAMGSNRLSETQTTLLMLVGQVLDLAHYPGARLIWLGAALIANGWLTGSWNAQRAAGSAPGAALRFALGMRQAWIPLAIITGFDLARDLTSWYLFFPSAGVRANLWHTLSYTFSGPLQMIAALVWFLAFLAVIYPRLKLVWAWFGLFTLLPPVWELLWNYGLSNLSWLHLPTGVAWRYDDKWYWAVGLLVLLALVDSFHARRWLLAYALYALALLSAVLSTFYRLFSGGLAAQDWSNGSWQSGLQSLINWQWSLGYLPSGASPTAYSQDVVSSGAQVCLLQADWVIARGHEALVLLALALNVLWLALLYAFIRYVVLRPYAVVGNE